MINLREIIGEISFIDIKNPPARYASEIMRVICGFLGYQMGCVVIGDRFESSIFASHNIPADYRHIINNNGSPLYSYGDSFGVFFVGSPCCDERYSRWREFIERFSVKTIVAMPLPGRERTFGTAMFFDVEPWVQSESEKDLLENLSIFLPSILKDNLYLDEINRKNASLVREISERAASGRRLIEQLNFLEALLDVLPNPFFYKDMNGRYLGCNKCFELFTGLRREQVIGKTAEEIFPSELAKKYNETDEELFRHGGIQIYDYVYRDAEGVMRNGVFNKTVFTDSEGCIAGIVAVGIDITEQKQLEAAQKKAMEKAESANRAKSLFLASMSHEIRTPLNSIIGFSEMLSSANLDREQREMVDYVRINGRHLISIIDNILDFSRIEDGKLELCPAEFDLESVMEEVMSVTRIHAAEKGVTVESHITDYPGDPLIGDPARLRQIVINLVTNAIKFTRDRVRVEFAVEAESETAIEVLFSISDNGAGISPDKIDRVFSPFVQADRNVARAHGGSGLGLAIADRLVRLMGGIRITVESEPGKGCEFRFRLTFKKASREGGPEECDGYGQDLPASPQARPPEKLKKLNILVVEDNYFNVQLLERFLQAGGHDVTCAQSGAEALDMVGSIRFDLVIMDIQMPEMDGVETFKRLRDRGVEIPVVALTADATRKNYDECMRAGMCGYVTKPVNMDELNAIMTNAVVGGNPVQTYAARPDGQALVFNYARMCDNFSGIPEAIGKFVNIFLKNRDAYIAELRGAIDDNDFERLRFSAHKLKGTAANACAETMCDMLREMEQFCCEEPSAAGAMKFVFDIENEFERYRGETKKRGLID